jgi:hypothetical protein
MDFVNPNRPNSTLDPFMRFLLREIAAGVGVSYESLSRDYSQSNYFKSSRLIDDRFGASFNSGSSAILGPGPQEWLEQAVSPE